MLNERSFEHSIILKIFSQCCVLIFGSIRALLFIACECIDWCKMKVGIVVEKGQLVVRVGSDLTNCRSLGRSGGVNQKFY